MYRMDNKLLLEVVDELRSLNTELGRALWNSHSHDDLLAVIDGLQEDLNSLIDHVEYQKFSLALHGDN